MAGELAGKVAIVVGSSSGMGRETARRFAQEGAAVVLAARSEAPLSELAQEITRAGGQALAVPTDAQDGAAVDRLIAQASDAFGRIDILVYATGTNIPA